MRTTDSKVVALRRVDFLRSCTDRELAKIAAKVDRTSVRAGYVLMQEGQYGNEAFIVVEGNAAVSMGGVTVATIGPGEFIGEMAMLNGRPRTATVVAETEMDVLVVGLSTFSTLAGHAEVGMALSRCLARRLADIQAHR